VISGQRLAVGAESRSEKFLLFPLLAAAIDSNATSQNEYHSGDNNNNGSGLTVVIIACAVWLSRTSAISLSSSVVRNVVVKRVFLPIMQRKSILVLL